MAPNALPAALPIVAPIATPIGPPIKPSSPPAVAPINPSIARLLLSGLSSINSNALVPTPIAAPATGKARPAILPATLAPLPRVPNILPPMRCAVPNLVPAAISPTSAA